MKRYFISGAVIFLIVIVAIVIFIQRQLHAAPVQRTAVVKELRKLNRLETAAMTIEKIIDAKSMSGNRLRDFFFGDKLLLVAQGEVIAGIDLSQLQEKDIVIKGKTISVTLPASQILVVSLDSQKTQVYDRQTGIFSKGDKNLETEARQEAERSIRQAACDAGILNDASEHARKQLVALFQVLNFESVTISIASSTCY